MALWREGGREERERERERERVDIEIYEYSCVACGATNLPPSQMDHQCETINAMLSLQILQYENEYAR